MWHFWRRKEEYKSQSLNAVAWRKFKGNPLGMASLIFIVLIAIVALLGYLITPDSTHFANRQNLSISLQKPMSKVQMLQITRNKVAENHSWIYTMLFGEEDLHEEVAIDSFRVEDNQLKVWLYGELPEFALRTYSLADVCYALMPESKVELAGDKVSFTTIDGTQMQKSLANLQQQVRNHIKQKVYAFGTDRYGRDLLSQLVIGARVSLSVGFVSVFIALVIGILLGAIAGYFRGWVDNLILWVINVVWSIPSLLLVIAISFALGKGFWQVFIAIGLTMWVDVARVVRGQVISLREKEFVESARAIGLRSPLIIFRHVVPNTLGTVIVIAASNFASAILVEAGLSFLGIGVQPPMPSWGSMIKENYGYIILDYAYLAIAPGIAIMLLVLAFMLIGNALRDAIDVK